MSVVQCSTLYTEYRADGGKCYQRSPNKQPSLWIQFWGNILRTLSLRNGAIPCRLPPPPMSNTSGYHRYKKNRPFSKAKNITNNRVHKPEVSDYWPEVADNLGLVIWSHATNSRQELEDALRGNAPQKPRKKTIFLDIFRKI